VRVLWGLAVLLCMVVRGQGRGDRPAVDAGFEGAIRPHSWIRGSGLEGGEKPRASVGPGAFYPSDIAAAYEVTPGLGGGSGVTIAIIDAFDSPNAEADLAVFSAQFGLPACTTANGCFQKVNETGGTTLPLRDPGWEIEINLDVQWVHALAPNAKILLVEASSTQSSDLFAGVVYAQQHASVISMSWGSPEGPLQTNYDGLLAKPGVTFLASTGDYGGAVQYPASSPHVIAVGGTNLGVSAGHLATPVAETAWTGTGGGCSAFEPAFRAQNGFVPSKCGHRGLPDVAMNGGSPSAVSVYISMQNGWYGVYGTSLAVQLFAAFIATVDGMRGRPLNSTAALDVLYEAAAGAPDSSRYLLNFRDITLGSAGGFAAGPGWDFTSGLGAPLAGSLTAFLMPKPKPLARP
jgi:subtilase family serine protease